MSPELNKESSILREKTRTPNVVTWSSKHTEVLAHKLDEKEKIKKDSERSLNGLNIHKISENIENIEAFFDKLEKNGLSNIGSEQIESLNINSSLLLSYIKDLKKVKIGKIDKLDLTTSIDSIKADIVDIIKSKNKLGLSKELVNKLNKILEINVFLAKNEQFHKKHGDYNDAICKELGVDSLLSEAIIEKESSFREYVKGRNGTGYMQLTIHPFRDLIRRPRIYQKYFSKLDDVNFGSLIKDSQVKQNIERVIELAKKGEFGKEWNNLIFQMQKNRVNPYYNLIIGNIYFASLYDKCSGNDLKKRLQALINYNGSSKKRYYARSVSSIYEKNLKNV